MVQQVRPSNVLEVGCGLGRNAHYFRKAVKYTGVDLSINLLRRAIPRQQPNSAGLVCGNASMLPFASSSFDLVFAVSTIAHVKPHAIADCAKELARLSSRYVCLIEFTEELDGRWFKQPHIFRHDYQSLLEPYCSLLDRAPCRQQIHPAIKEYFLFEKRA